MSCKNRGTEYILYSDMAVGLTIGESEKLPYDSSDSLVNFIQAKVKLDQVYSVLAWTRK